MRDDLERQKDLLVSKQSRAEQDILSLGQRIAQLEADAQAGTGPSDPAMLSAVVAQRDHRIQDLMDELKLSFRMLREIEHS